MKSINLTQAREFLFDLVPQAGKILKRYFVSRKFTQRQKKGVDFSTQADVEVDSFLVKHIKKRYPHAKFLTEETAPSDYSSLRNEDILWVIDPLDGTINFSRRHENFAISIGLVDKGIPKLGVVHNPLSGDTYWAQEEKEGSFLNGHEIKVSKTFDYREVILACDWPYDFGERLKVVNWIGILSQHVRQIKALGSAVADLAKVADGRIDCYIHAGLKPWDQAAAGLLILKAGGKITTSTGAKWDVFQPDVLAANRTLHKKILDLINKKYYNKK